MVLLRVVVGVVEIVVEVSVVAVVNEGGLIVTRGSVNEGDVVEWVGG